MNLQEDIGSGIKKAGDDCTGQRAIPANRQRKSCGGPAESIRNRLKNRNRNPFLDELMAMTKMHEARQRAAREGVSYPADEGDGAGDEEL